MKKSLAFLLALLMLVTLLPTMALADDEPIAWIDKNGNEEIDEGETYTSIYEAIAEDKGTPAAPSETPTEIKLLGDVGLTLQGPATNTTVITVGEGQNIIIDLAGYTIQLLGNYNNDVSLISNKGTLKLYSSSEVKGTISNMNGYCVFGEKGELIVENLSLKASYYALSINFGSVSVSNCLLNDGNNGIKLSNTASGAFIEDTEICGNNGIGIYCECNGLTLENVTVKDNHYKATRLDSLKGGVTTFYPITLKGTCVITGNTWLNDGQDMLRSADLVLLCIKPDDVFVRASIILGEDFDHEKSDIGVCLPDSDLFSTYPPVVLPYKLLDTHEDCFFINQYEYVIDPNTTDCTSVISRIKTQPSAENSYTFELYTDDLSEDKLPQYSWTIEQEVGLEDLDNCIFTNDADEAFEPDPDCLLIYCGEGQTAKNIPFDSDYTMTICYGGALSDISYISFKCNAPVLYNWDGVFYTPDENGVYTIPMIENLGTVGILLVPCASENLTDLYDDAVITDMKVPANVPFGVENAQLKGFTKLGDTYQCIATFVDGSSLVSESVTVTKYTDNEISGSFSCSDITVGGTPAPKGVTAKYGEIVYLYSADGENWGTWDEVNNGVGTYYVKAVVKDTADYNGFETAPESFEVEEDGSDFSRFFSFLKTFAKFLELLGVAGGIVALVLTVS